MLLAAEAPTAGEGAWQRSASKGKRHEEEMSERQEDGNEEVEGGPGRRGGEDGEGAGERLGDGDDNAYSSDSEASRADMPDGGGIEAEPAGPGIEGGQGSAEGEGRMAEAAAAPTRAKAVVAAGMDALQKRAANIRRYAGDSHEAEMEGVKEALKSLEARRASESVVAGAAALDLYTLREMLAAEQKMRAAAEAAPRIAEARLLEAEERAAAAEAERDAATAAHQTAILECRRDRRAAAEEVERVRLDATQQLADAATLVAAAERERDERIAEIMQACQAEIAAIRERAADDAREQVASELEEARRDAATAEAQVDDIRAELERMQAHGASAIAEAERRADSIARECKALSTRITNMEGEIRQKVDDARAMEAAKAAKQVAELRDAKVLAQAALKRAEDRAAKAEKRAEKAREAVLMTAESGGVAQVRDHGDSDVPRVAVMASQGNRKTSLTTAATEKRTMRVQEEARELREQLSALTAQYRDLQKEFLMRERDIKLSAGDKVDAARDLQKKADLRVADLRYALSLTIKELEAAGLVVPFEVLEALRSRSPGRVASARPATKQDPSSRPAEDGRGASSPGTTARPLSSIGHSVLIDSWMWSDDGQSSLGTPAHTSRLSSRPPPGDDGTPPSAASNKPSPSRTGVSPDGNHSSANDSRNLSPARDHPEAPREQSSSSQSRAVSRPASVPKLRHPPAPAAQPSHLEDANAALLPIQRQSSETASARGANSSGPPANYARIRAHSEAILASQESRSTFDPAGGTSPPKDGPTSSSGKRPFSLRRLLADTADNRAKALSPTRRIASAGGVRTGAIGGNAKRPVQSAPRNGMRSKIGESKSLRPSSKS